LYLLMLQKGFNPDAPLSVWALFSIVGILITWAVFLINVRKWRLEEAEHRIKIERDHEATARRVARDVVYEEIYSEKRDKRVRELAQHEISYAFSKRAESFVDAKQYETDRRNFNERMERLETSIDNNTKTVAQFAEKLTTMVIRDALAEEFRNKNKGGDR
jgi:hypothetical protein